MGPIRQTARSIAAAFVVALACAACSEQQDKSAGVPAPAAAASEGKPVQEQILTLSPRAADQLRAMRDKGKLKPDAIVRIAVTEGNFFRMKNGGEKRYRYTMLIDDDPKDLDQYVAMESQGLTIHVPRTSADFLRGTNLIWIESGGRGGFKFQNPNQLAEDEAGRVLPGPERPGSPDQGGIPGTPSATPGVGPTPLDD